MKNEKNKGNRKRIVALVLAIVMGITAVASSIMILIYAL